MPSLVTALEAWRQHLGHERVVIDEATRELWGRRTFLADVPIAAIIRPANAGQVPDCLKIATSFAVPIHPVSRGANWGMGSRAPTVDHGVVLDLSDLTQISHFDARYGIVHVEPGVTFADLSAFLKARTAHFFVPEIGGAVKASVLANTLDRGDGMMGDRWSAVGDLDIVLPDGRRFQTGYRGQGAHALAGMAPSAAGPMLEGLFSQSNLGVVVGATIRLSVMPDNMAMFMAVAESEGALADMIEAWRGLQRTDTVATRGVSLWNGIKFLARQTTRGAVAPDRLRSANCAEWYLSGVVCGETDAILAERQRLARDAFSSSADNVSFALLRDNGAWLPGCETFVGTPSEQNLRSCYWRQDTIQPLSTMDPDGDNCGLVWLCLAFPFDGDFVADFVHWVAALLAEHDLDLNIGLEAPNAQTLLSYIVIAYDRDHPAHEAIVPELYERILLEAHRRGIAPYRLANGLPVPKIMQSSAAARDYVRQIKLIGDPGEVLSKGRGAVPA